MDSFGGECEEKLEGILWAFFRFYLMELPVKEWTAKEEHSWW